MKFTLLLWWVFSPLSLVGERKSPDNKTQQVDVYLVDQVGDGLHRGKLYTCTDVQVRVTGTCPTHCVASWHREALGMPTLPPHQCWHQLHLNTQPPLHTLCSMPRQTSLDGNVTHTLAWLLQGGLAARCCHILPVKPVLTDTMLHFPKITSLISDMPRRSTGNPGLHSSLSWCCRRSSSCTRRLSQQVLMREVCWFFKEIKIVSPQEAIT